MQRWRRATNGHGRGRAFILGTMKGFGKIAILFGLLGGVMAYFIFPCNSPARAPYHQPTEAEYVWTVSNYKGTGGPVAQNIEQQAKAYAGESGAEDIGLAWTRWRQHRRQVIGDRLTRRSLIGALWLHR